MRFHVKYYLIISLHNTQDLQILIISDKQISIK